MGYEKLDRSRTARNRLTTKQKFFRFTKTLGIILCVNMLAVLFIMFAVRVSSNDAQAAESLQEEQQNSEMVKVIRTGDVFTVSIDDGMMNGYEWKYGISSSNKLRELLRFESEEVAIEEELARLDGRWTVSFVSTHHGTGNVKLTFFYTKNGVADNSYTRDVQVNISEDYKIRVVQQDASAL